MTIHYMYTNNIVIWLSVKQSISMKQQYITILYATLNLDITFANDIMKTPFRYCLQEIH